MNELQVLLDTTVLQVCPVWFYGDGEYLNKRLESGSMPNISFIFSSNTACYSA